MTKSLKTLILIEVMVPIALLTLGIYHGLVQTLYRAGLIKSTSFLGLEYYQGLTIHGVVNAIVLTTFFAVAFGHATVTFYLGRKTNENVAWLSGIVMLIGTLMASWAMLAGEANVLYTFYPPLKAHPLFYLGAALLIVGSWIAFFGWVATYLSWRKDNPEKKLPLPVLGTLINFTIWFLCSLAVAYEVLVLLLPWSLGITETVNVMLCRTLFWFFGHALVYFWLLPAYVMFYSMLPKLAGGKLYSDMAGRIVFFLFLIFSIPIGVHHQFSDPSISQGIKFVQGFMTFGVAIPSLITAFTIAASLEYAGRKRGAKGWFGWMTKLPYFEKDNYLFAYLICGLIMFIPGGFTGLVNASYNLNSLVHNTAWMPGHFHMTVAGPVFLGILGMSMYLLEQLTGKEVRYKKLNMLVPYLWVIGTFIFSTGLMWGGLMGEPRRTNMGLSYMDAESTLYNPYWVYTTALTVMGGIMMFVSGIVYIWTFFATALSKKRSDKAFAFPEYAVYHDEPRVYMLDSFTPWVILAVILILLAYIPAIMDVMNYSGPGAPPFLPDNPMPLN